MSPDGRAVLEGLRRIDCGLMDFDRTLVQLFDDASLARVTGALRELYVALAVDRPLLQGYTDPYAMWSGIHQWLSKRQDELTVSQIDVRIARELSQYEIQAAGSAQLLPEVRETLEWLRNRLVRCGIVSSNSAASIHRVLDATGTARIFECVRGRVDEAPKHKLKPSPDPLLEAIGVLGSVPRNSFFVGDSRDDAAAARAAGVVAIGVLSGKTTAVELIEAGAHVVIWNFSDLRDLLSH